MPFETIYVPLLEEGTDVWRPVVAEKLIDETFRILGEMPEDERWEYRPGQRVFVKQHVFSGPVSGLVAYRLAEE